MEVNLKERREKASKLHRRKIRLSEETKIYGAEELKYNIEKNQARNLGFNVADEQKKIKHKLLKKINIKRVITIVAILIICFAVFFGIKAHNWKTIVKEMAKQENSKIIDTNNETVATIGKDKKKVSVVVD